MDKLFHILQFCQQCHWKKVAPVPYTFIEPTSIQPWLSSVYLSLGINTSKPSKRLSNDILSDSPDTDISTKISRKDAHIINTMLKIHETLDNNITKSSKEKEEKEPGFNRLEVHKKQLASTTPPFEKQASEPVEFLKAFLQRKTQFKAKELLIHCRHMENIAFHPSSSFTSCLWNCDFLWLTPDVPSGISIFFCPELSSLNTQEIERDRNSAAVDKSNTSTSKKSQRTNSLSLIPSWILFG
jgi:hypothetical protein